MRRERQHGAPFACGSCGRCERALPAVLLAADAGGASGPMQASLLPDLPRGGDQVGVEGIGGHGRGRGSRCGGRRRP